MKQYTFVPIDIWSLLKIVVEEDASDLFITVGLPPSIKQHGHLRALSDIPMTRELVSTLAQNTMTPAQLDEFKDTLELNFAITHPDIGRYRVNVFQQQNELGIAIRRIKTDIPQIEELGLSTVLAV